MFGKNIKKIRNVKGLSQQAFAELFDLKRATLGAYEEGRSNPKLETILKIAEHFKISTDDLLFSELTVNRLLDFNDSITTNTEDLKIEEFARIPYISEALQADYIRNHAKKSFTDRLPRLQLPLDPKPDYIAYTISDLTMTNNTSGFFPKDIVIGVKKEKDFLLKPGTLVLVLTSERLIFRRAFLKEHLLNLQADHTAIESIDVDTNDIIEIWEICHVFHNKIPAKNDQVEDRLAQLEKEIQSITRNNTDA